MQYVHTCSLPGECSLVLFVAAMHGFNNNVTNTNIGGTRSSTCTIVYFSCNCEHIKGTRRNSTSVWSIVVAHAWPMAKSQTLTTYTH